MPADFRQSAAIAAASILASDARFIRSHHVACYLASREEFDCEPIIKLIRQTQKNCYLPALKDKHLEFKHYNLNDPLRLNHYKILEPESSQVIPTPELDIVLVPLVGFDPQGNRLGMGGGFYDRTFAFLRENQTHKPLLIGLAYESQQLPELPPDPWDVRLDAVLTEKRLLNFV